MPTLTRANVELEVCNIVGRLMTLVGLYGTAQACNGSNPHLNRPITDGLTRMGYPIADPTGLTSADVDFASLDPRALRRLLEWSELFVLEQVERDWWRAEMNPGPTLEPRVVGGAVVDPLGRLKSRIIARIAELRRIITMPYQSMNVPLSVGQITIGSIADTTLPPTISSMIPPALLGPDGVWYYGYPSSNYWGWDGWPL